MKVAVFGGTGFVGSYVIEELVASGHEPKVLVRQGSEHKLLKKDECKVIKGALSNRSAVEETISDVDSVIYLVGIIREFPRKGITFESLHFKGAKDCMDVAADVGVKRFILMSANGACVDGWDYHKTKFMAEQYLKCSQLDWTIFRPSLIFGDPRGENRPEFCSQLKKDMLSLPIPAPLFFNGVMPRNAGNFSMSPIHISDVSKCFVTALTQELSIGQTYTLGGETTFKWNQLIDVIAKSYNKKKWKIPAPAIGVKLAALFFDRFGWFPISRDQLNMLMEGNTCDGTKAFQDFAINPIPFSSENLRYLKP